MEDFIDLSRRFRDLTANELEEPELLAALSERDFVAPDGWAELLASARVLLLAEAGSGKTYEMRAECIRLQAEGKFAFFVPLESLGRGRLVDLLSADDERSFESWKTDGRSLAWFFLDAVDELKLAERKLDEALGTFAKAIDGQLDRARIVLSCRPSDWRPALDKATFARRLPYVTATKSGRPTADEFFLRSLDEYRSGEKREKDGPTTPERTVVLLPLSESRIELYAKSRGVKDTAAFLAEIRKENAWAFARRPLDCNELVAIWIAKGRMGTRLEQHEANITAKLKDDPDRPDRGVLSGSRAREGAERLALALVLTRTRTVRVPERAPDMEPAAGVLDSADVLPGWTEEERQSLLRRPIFDPATYGRVRFHHSSVQDYLAACRLKYLRDKGMPARRLLGFLFATRYGVDVVVPSMRPVAAWLATWDNNVRRTLVGREPETLLSMGDPGSLPIDARAALLRSFATLYGQGGWRGLDIPWTELRRLAHPELAETIRQLWAANPTNEDVREVLLELIWQGPIIDCADIAANAATNSSLTGHERIIAIRGVIACNHRDAARRIVDGAMEGRDQWPESVLHSLAQELFPDFMSVSELIALVERATSQRSRALGFDWVLRQIVAALDPWSRTALELRDRLADLILRTRDDKLEWHKISGRFDKHAVALAMLCDGQLTARPDVDDKSLIAACAIANRFGRHLSSSAEVQKLSRHFAPVSPLRAQAFWSELALLDQLAPASDDRRQLYHVEHEGLIGALQQDDRPWLGAAASDAASGKRRGVALMGLIQLWAWRGRIEAEAESIRNLVVDDAKLHVQARQHTARVEPDPELRKLDRDNRRYKRIREGREKQRKEGWVKWRREVLADLAAAFAPENRRVTIRNLYTWLDRQDESRSRFNAWTPGAVAEAFGLETVKYAAAAFKDSWRDERPRTWSERKSSERHTTPYVWIYGLCGLAVESSSNGWGSKLTSEEARVATTYATIELNGFPEWLGPMADVHAKEIIEVLGRELDAQLALAREEAHLPLLQDLTHAEHKIKRLMTPRVLAQLQRWPSPSGDAAIDSKMAKHLAELLRILIDGIEDGDRSSAAALCVERYGNIADPSSALPWLRALFKLDARRAAALFTASFQNPTGPAVVTRAVQGFATLFGEAEGVLPEIADNIERARVLSQLVRAAYTFVRREDDREHEGTYTPDARDDAERARNILLSALLDTPGNAAREAILELAQDALFDHMPDRLRMLARQRAAIDAEPTPLTPAAIVELEARFEARPRNRDDLFNTMMDRLDDLAHDIAHDDFTDRPTLQSITSEHLMQLNLARRLREMARGAYQVTREEEVADSKKTDIRLATIEATHRAAIEVKIADNDWTIEDLERALVNQLVGQYLRHATSKAGCLLLTYSGRKKHWRKPSSDVRMSFDEVVAYLVARATQVEMESHGEYRLAVAPLDLRDPELAPAHR